MTEARPGAFRLVLFVYAVIKNVLLQLYKLQDLSLQDQESRPFVFGGIHIKNLIQQAKMQITHACS
jgi:hypothetical protein